MRTGAKLELDEIWGWKSDLAIVWLLISLLFMVIEVVIYITTIINST
jgi:hypothetical protein